MRKWFNRLAGIDDSAGLDKQTRRAMLDESSLSTSRSTMRSALKLMKPFWMVEREWKMRDHFNWQTVKGIGTQQFWTDLRQDAKSGRLQENIKTSLSEQWDDTKHHWKTWGKEGKWINWALLASSIGFTYWQVTDVQVGIAHWSRDFGNVLQDAAGVVMKNEHLLGNPDEMINLPEMQEQVKTFTSLLTNDFALLVAKLLTAAGSAFVLAQRLSLRWSKQMTSQLTDLWLDNKAFFRLQSVYKNADNPDQRIEVDIENFTGTSMSIVTDAFRSALTLTTFSGLLWGMSGDVNLKNMGGPDLNIPHFMFWCAIAYAGVGTWATHKIGKRLAPLDYAKQKLKAIFRSSLKRTVENAEQIALNNGEEIEKKNNKEKFEPVYENGKKIITKRKQLIISRAAYANMASPFPYIITAPEFFTGRATIGTLKETAYNFSQVQESLSWFIDNYQTLAELKATTDRLGGFVEGIEQSNRDLRKKAEALNANGNGRPFPAPAPA